MLEKLENAGLDPLPARALGRDRALLDEQDRTALDERLEGALAALAGPAAWELEATAAALDKREDGLGAFGRLLLERHPLDVEGRAADPFSAIVLEARQ